MEQPDPDATDSPRSCTRRRVLQVAALLGGAGLATAGADTAAGAGDVLQAPTIAGDPDDAEPGDIWYNSEADDFRVQTGGAIRSIVTGRRPQRPGAGFGGGEIGEYGLTGPAVEPDRDGRTVYIAPGGDDSNAGTADAPIATFGPVSAGGRLAEEIDGLGKIVIAGDLTLTAPSQGWDSPADDILVTGAAGTRPTVTATWTDDVPVFHVQRQTHNYFRGFNVDWAADGVGWRAIRFDNCNVDGSLPLAGIEAAKAAGWVYNVGVQHAGNSAVMWGGVCVGGVMEHCDSRYHYGPAPGDRPGGDDADGVQMTGARGEVHRGGVIRNNVISHVSDDGVDLYRARGVIVRDNVVLATGYREDGSTRGIDVAGKGIKLGGDDSNIDRGGNLAMRNLVIGCGGAGIGANGANLPIDVLFNTVLFNARKSDRSYEDSIELWAAPGGGPAGNRLDGSRVIGNIFQQEVFVGPATGSVQGNIHANHASIDPLSGVPDGAVPDSVPAIGFDDAADLSGIVDAGPRPEEIWPTPASRWYGEVELPYEGDAPDLGAFEAGAPDRSGSDDTDGPVANVRDHGAVGDGRTDDTQAIRAAADAAGPGGTVYFPRGTYLVGSNSNYPLDYPMDGSWEGLTWAGEAWDATTIRMAGGHSAFHMLFRAQSRGGHQLGDVTFEQLRFDMNAGANARGSGWFGVADGDGTVTMRDCVVADTLNFGVQVEDAMAADIQHCAFRNIGDPSLAAGHCINPNPDSPQTYDVARCLFEGGSGQAVNMGRDDTGNDWVTLNYEWNYRQGGVGGIKISTEAAQATIRNSYFDGDPDVTTRTIKSNSPEPADCGRVSIADCRIEGDSASGIDLACAGGHPLVELDTVALVEVAQDGERSFGAGNGKAITILRSAVDAGRISAHQVGPNNDGAALFCGPDATGTIEAVSHAGTGALGTTNGVAVGTNAAAGSAVAPDVPSRADVGPR